MNFKLGTELHGFTVESVDKIEKINQCVYQLKYKKNGARVNDRGPYKKKRIVDVSKKIATELGFIDKGTARVKLDIISYPKKYDKARGITPYKQKVVQIVAYSQKSYAVRGALKLKQELYPIPVFIDQPKTDVFYVLTGPFNSS